MKMKHKILFMKISLLNVSFGKIRFMALFIFTIIFLTKLSDNLAWFTF